MLLRNVYICQVEVDQIEHERRCVIDTASEKYVWIVLPVGFFSPAFVN